MARIIVSYRRSDSAAIAGRIFDRLTDRFGDASVFMDIDKIPLGVHYEDHLRQVLGDADIVLAVIGPNWLGKTADGASRIMENGDPVRFEIETALQHKVTLIPVLVDGASMPRRDQVPESLWPFTYFNAATVDIGRDFRAHMDRLMNSIDATRADDVKAATRGRRRLAIYSAATAAALIVAAVFAFAPGHWLPARPAAETASAAADTASPSAVPLPFDMSALRAAPQPSQQPDSQRAPAQATYRVLANVSDGVQNLRQGPAVKYPIVISIPAGAGGITVGECRPAEDNTRPWCEATWRKYSGWISSCCIVDEKTGAPPRIAASTKK